MGKPWNCRNLDDYLNWVWQVIEYSGGYLLEEVLETEEFEDDFGEVVGGIIPRHNIQFFDGTRLCFQQQVNLEGEVDEYHYTYMLDDGTGICRLDKHPGHERKVGGLEHLHVGPTNEDEVIYPAPHCDFDDAIRYVREYARDQLGIAID